MRRTILIAVLVLALGAAAALGEASEARAFEITAAALQSDGSVRVEWTDSADAGPYRVLFQSRGVENRDEPGNAVTTWCNSGEVSGNLYDESYMVPDGNYWLIVVADDGAQAVREYSGKCDSLPRNLVGASLRFARINYIANGYTEASAIDALVRDDILNADDKTGYGFLLTVTCGESRLYGEHTLRLAAGDVRGGSTLVGMTSLPLNAETASGITIWQDLSDWLSDFIDRAASYDSFWITAYLDDMLICTKPLCRLK